MFQCLHGTAPLYLMNNFTQTADVASRQHLHCGPAVFKSWPFRVMSTRQLWSSVFHCCGPVNLEFAATQSSWLSSESYHLQPSAENSLYCEILRRRT